MTDEFGKDGDGPDRRTMGGHLRVLPAESHDAGGYARDNHGRATCGRALE